MKHRRIQPVVTLLALALATNVVAAGPAPARPAAAKPAVKKAAVKKRTPPVAPKKKAAPTKAATDRGSGGGARPVTEDPNDWKVNIKIHYGPGK